MTAPDATASYEWLSRLARSLGQEDPRTMDARRADLMAAMLTGRLTIDPPGDNLPSEPTAGPTAEPAGPAPVRITRPPAAPGKPLVHIVMPYSTLIGVDDLPGELAGYGPIPADLVRDIAADAVWKRLLHDPLSGTVLDVGRTTYRPPEALADHVRARDSPVAPRSAGAAR